VSTREPESPKVLVDLEWHPVATGRTRKSTGGAAVITLVVTNSLTSCGFGDAQQKFQAVSRTAFSVNQPVANVRSRLKSSPGRG